MLSLLANLYGKVTALRNLLYDRGHIHSHDLGAFTVSVGNLTVGGTGKTPLTALVAGTLSDRGEKVCILTRGYGRRDARSRVVVSNWENVLAEAASGGDEPVELARKLKGKAIVIADADRVSAAAWAKQEFGVTAFVLDDAFQHRRAKRDVDIVCIDSSEPLTDARMLPAGKLREAVTGLHRADVVVIMNSGNTSESVIDRLRKDIADIAQNIPIFVAEKDIDSIRKLDGEVTDELVNKSGLFAFCGLANPQNFAAFLRANSIVTAGFREFADHHSYSREDIRELEARAKEAGASALLTTAKDAVKLNHESFSMPCYVIEIGLQLDDLERFTAIVTSGRGSS